MIGRVIKEIPVQDQNGDQVALYVWEVSERIPIVGLRRKVICYKLDSGEQAHFVDDNTFAVSKTGEKLIRLPDS